MKKKKEIKICNTKNEPWPHVRIPYGEKEGNMITTKIKRGWKGWVIRLWMN